MPKIHTYYDTLSVARNAPPEVIRAAYKTLSQKYHPDRNFENPNATAMMAKINEAYAVLSDVEKRKRYDKWLENKEASASQQDDSARKPEPEKSFDIQDLYAAVIGEKNTDYYLAKFKKFDEQKAGLKISWNGASFLFNSVWSLYRKMYGWFFILSGIGIFFNILGKAAPDVSFFVLIPMIIFGMFADSLYHEKVKQKIAKAQLTIKNEAKLVEFLQSQAGVHNWIIGSVLGLAAFGIIASIAIPAFQDYKTRQAATANITASAPPPSVTVEPTNATIEPPPISAEPTIAAVEPAPINFNEIHELLRQNRYAEALPLVQKAAEQGNAQAQWELASMHQLGLGVTQDYTQAVIWLNKAVEQGHAQAEWQLGNLYYKGQGVTQDYTQAAILYRKSAEQGDPDGQKELAGMFYEAQDYIQAANWARKSAMQGNVDAQFGLSVMYAEGKGVNTDSAQALFWLQKAAAQGHLKAQEILKTYENSLQN